MDVVRTGEDYADQGSAAPLQGQGRRGQGRNAKPTGRVAENLRGGSTSLDHGDNLLRTYRQMAGTHRRFFDGVIGAKPKAEVVVDILASIKERRPERRKVTLPGAIRV